MLSFKEIAKHYSERENRLPQLVLKEYLQYKILDIIFSSKYGSHIAFMGGTAVRLVYGSDRFSEDLDLDNDALSEHDFSDLTKIVERELLKDGIETEFRNTFKGVYHCYLKFPRILFENKLSPLRDEKILIRLDSFQTKYARRAEPFALAKADVFSEIRVYPASLLLAQKIDALFHRDRRKGRDIYDIVYLFSLTNPDYSYLKKTVGVSCERELMEKMKKLLSEKELSDLARDVSPFLLDSQKVARVEKFHLWIKGRESVLVQ